MTTGDWLGLVCLAGLVGFFAGGFFVWNLFFKRQEPDDDDEDEIGTESPDEERHSDEEHCGRDI